jgi:hypothetical protein
MTYWSIVISTEAPLLSCKSKKRGAVEKSGLAVELQIQHHFNCGISTKMRRGFKPKIRKMKKIFISCRTKT